LQANSEIVYRQLQRVAETNELWICQMSRAGIPTFRFLNVRQVDISKIWGQVLFYDIIKIKDLTPNFL